MTDKAVVAIIPARGGSKGIPRKNVRFLAGRPLISYAITNALKSRLLGRVVVTTDDEEIANVAKAAGCETVTRPDELARDDVPLDPVIHHAVEYLEQKHQLQFDIVVTIQPTSPLLSPESMDRAIEQLVSGKKDTVISVVDDRHLAWTEKDGQYVPTYEERKNRQFLPPRFRETGGIMVTRRMFVKPDGRFGPAIDLFVVPEKEAVDIDHQMDWWIAEKLLNRKKILIRTSGYDEIGLGHVYRTLLLAGRLIDHDLLFTTNAEHRLGLEMIRNSFYPFEPFENETGFDAIVERYQPDMLINDILDTEAEYIGKLKARGIFVVNFEDMGDGAPEADVVINALYEKKLPLDNYFWGKDYYCLREEFLLVPQKEIHPEVRNILLTFGGTDFNNYSARILKLLSEMKLGDTGVTVITGRGYKHSDELEQLAQSLDLEAEVLQDVRTISRHMHRADIVFTSAGRTVYEIASIGTPMIVLAQNNRELQHTFARSDNGIINLGLGPEVSDREIESTLRRLIEDLPLRQKCHQLMLKNDLRFGVDTVLKTIFEKFEAARGKELK